MKQLIRESIYKIFRYLYGAGTMEDYYYIKEKYNSENMPERQVQRAKRKIRLYGKLVTWESWKQEKSKERKQLEEAIFLKDDLLQLYPEEVKFLRKNQKLMLYPYKFSEKYRQESIKVYEKDNLCYVLHNGRKLFFPKEESSSIKNAYNQLIMEQDFESPHRYFSDSHDFEEGMIFIDVGSAEGIISLDIVEKASEIFLLECSKVWHDALKATFEEYRNKVHIIRKKAGDCIDRSTITLDKLLEGYHDKRIFVKMDVEGMELEALKGAERVMKDNDVTFACTTYHMGSQYDSLKQFFSKHGYETETPEGVMLFVFGRMTLINGKYEKMEYPYFRNGLIRAWKNKESNLYL